MSLVRSAARLALGTLGVAGAFVVSTVLNGSVPDSVIVAAGALGIVVAGIVVGGVKPLAAAWAWQRAWIGVAVAGGVSAWWAAPLLVMSQRASDAPPGTEVAFFTLSAWGLLTVGVDQALSRDRSAVVLAASLLALVGGMTLLASWEFPSSFSPFVRFPVRHALMLVAGALFAGGSVALLAAARRIDLRAAMLAGALGAAAIATAVALPGLGSESASVARHAGSLLVLAVFAALFAQSWLWSSREHGMSRSSVILGLAPAALTALTVMQYLTKIYGPDPVRWPAVLSGIALALVGSAVIWVASGSGSISAPSALTRPMRALQAAAGAAAVVSLAALATPALSARVEGAFGEVYRATWTMSGVESAQGWLVAGLGLLALASVRAARTRTRAALAGVLAVVASSLAYPFIAATPLRTATLWIPADVQQSYGTEYARLGFTAIHDPVRLGALGLVLLVSIGLLAVLLRSPDRPEALEVAR